jgi:hypothetical protein
MVLKMERGVSVPGNDTKERRQRERLRRTFRPARLRLLFIGESPPASGRFFYRCNSGLYRAMRDAFRMIDPSINDENFLAVFQATGCYLVDLCPVPVDHLDSESRQNVCRASEELLSGEIARLRPAMIASLLRSIEGNVARAASRAHWRGPFIYLPYPGRWSGYRSAFVDTLTPAIRVLVRRRRGDVFKEEENDAGLLSTVCPL